MEETLKLSWKDKIHLMYLFNDREHEIDDPDFHFTVVDDSDWKLSGWDSFERSIKWTDGVGHYFVRLISGGDPRNDEGHVWEKGIPNEIKPYSGKVRQPEEKIFVVVFQPYKVYSTFEVSAKSIEDVKRIIEEEGGVGSFDAETDGNDSSPEIIDIKEKRNKRS